MDTSDTRVTRARAAELADVSERTINRWSERGWIKVYRPDGPWAAALYDAEEVVAVAERRSGVTDLALPETDIAT